MVKNRKIKEAFDKVKADSKDRKMQRLHISWSNWGFGTEPLEVSVRRLSRYGVRYIELHGNHYGPDLGYKPSETRKILADHGIRAAGICGMFSVDNDLSSNRPACRQAAIDYIRRELEFAAAVGAGYMLVVPAAVGRPDPYDSFEFSRSVETLGLVAELFQKYKVRAAIEPIRSAEVSIIHTIREAKEYIAAVGHPGIQHINGDVYHMQTEESHIGEALLEAGPMLTNLHMADSSRGALGEGSMDLDTILMALYVIGYNQDGCYITPEPLGPGSDPYPAMHKNPDPQALDALVEQTVRYIREREDELFSG